jgi:hypothetical protein
LRGDDVVGVSQHHSIIEVPLVVGLRQLVEREVALHELVVRAEAGGEVPGTDEPGECRGVEILPVAEQGVGVGDVDDSSRVARIGRYGPLRIGAQLILGAPVCPGLEMARTARLAVAADLLVPE